MQKVRMNMSIFYTVNYKETELYHILFISNKYFTNTNVHKRYQSFKIFLYKKVIQCVMSINKMNTGYCLPRYMYINTFIVNY